MTTLWLTDPEIADLCDGLVQPGAQIRYLRDVLGLVVKKKPNGHALVVRSHAEAVLAGRQDKPQAAPSAPDGQHTQPNRAKLLQLVGGRTNGTTQKVQSA